MTNKDYYFIHLNKNSNVMLSDISTLRKIGEINRERGLNRVLNNSDMLLRTIKKYCEIKEIPYIQERDIALSQISDYLNKEDSIAHITTPGKKIKGLRERLKEMEFKIHDII
ncbi:MAG: hypothetical protein ACOC3Z_00105 [Nanoarchaeota archaeon]